MAKQRMLGTIWMRLGSRQAQVDEYDWVRGAISRAAADKGCWMASYRIADARGDERAHAPKGIVQSESQGAMFQRRRLGHKGRAGRLGKAHAEADDEAAGDEHAKVLGRRLDDGADEGEHGRQADALPAAKGVDDEAGEEGGDGAADVGDAGVERLGRRGQRKVAGIRRHDVEAAHKGAVIAQQHGVDHGHGNDEDDEHALRARHKPRQVLPLEPLERGHGESEQSEQCL